MKSKLILGMVATTLIAATAFAGPAARGVNVSNIKAEMSKYTDTVVKSYLFGKGRTSASGLASQAAKIANDKAFDKFELRADEKSAVTTALTVSSKEGRSDVLVEKRLENLAALIGARKVGQSLKERSETDAQAEGQSLIDASNALMKTLANSIFKGTKTTSQRLSKEEMSDSSKALEKLENISESVVRMDKSERDMYTAVEVKRDELLQTGKFSGEEALVEAVMNVKSVDKAKAMEIVRKLKDCV
ncbi:MAG TPA: hypothetical protein PL182_02300 [Pseudobdellovibrionaceae bacterium]|nr:hypothetical protein [Pseudobdellovibrionaceae bacterium]